MSYPTLSIRWQTIDIQDIDNSIRENFESGYEVRRKRYTRSKKRFVLTYTLLSDADRGLLENHYDTYGCFDTFDFTYGATTYTVYFDKPLRFATFCLGWSTVEAIEMIEQ